MMKTRTKRTRTGRDHPGSQVIRVSPRQWPLLVLLTIFAALPCWSQTGAPDLPPPTHSSRPDLSSSRTIEGTVLSASGVPVPGAIVLIKDLKTLQVRSYVAQQDGKYHFYGLSTGSNYQLRAQAQGLTSKTKTVSVFDSHRKVVLDLKLAKKMKV